VERERAYPRQCVSRQEATKAAQRLVDQNFLEKWYWACESVLRTFSSRRNDALTKKARACFIKSYCPVAHCGATEKYDRMAFEEGVSFEKRKQHKAMGAIAGAADPAALFGCGNGAF
jgi:hypothetical protein